ncbi:MAG: UPF0262 family protein [Rhodospirillales bacterium]|nr:UPF0262 family protein [Rhodospirillales bacterium]
MADAKGRLTRIVLDGEALHRISSAQRADQEQAVRDLVQESAFYLPDHPDMHIVLHLSIHEGRLVLDARDESGQPIQAILLALGPFKTLIRDYRMLLDSYAGAIAEGREARIQAIDMGRRGLHNEGAELMMRRLEGKVTIDFSTARRLFTLVCALHQKL